MPEVCCLKEDYNKLQMHFVKPRTNTKNKRKIKLASQWWK